MKDFLEKYFDQIGWLISLLVAWLAPKFTAPIGVVLPFALFAAIGVLGGFLLGSMHAKGRAFTGMSEGMLNLCSLGVVFVSACIYFPILTYVGTPTIFMEVAEAVPYFIGHTAIGVLIYFGYKHGAEFIISKF